MYDIKSVDMDIIEKLFTYYYLNNQWQPVIGLFSLSV